MNYKRFELEHDDGRGKHLIIDKEASEGFGIYQPRKFNCRHGLDMGDIVDLLNNMNERFLTESELEELDFEKDRR